MKESANKHNITDLTGFTEKSWDDKEREYIDDIID